MRKITPELINALIDVVKTRADETLSRSELNKLTALKTQLENLPKAEDALSWSDRYGKDYYIYPKLKDWKKSFLNGDFT